MSKKFIKPDFQNNIINVSATLADLLGCPNDKPILPSLAEKLRNNYKNIVLLIVDGLGMYPICQNLTSGSFIYRNITQTLTSVFPSTTTNATTTLLTNRYPMEHSWYGWSLYFEELDKVVELFPERDTFTHVPIEKGYVKRHLPAKPFYKSSRSDYTSCAIVPKFWHGDEEDRIDYDTIDQMYSSILSVCRSQGKHFIYAYSAEPDSTMHRYGVSSAEARSMIVKIDNGVEKLASELQDTLLILTADHGQTDIGENIELYRDAELLSLLAQPPSLEARAIAFRPKDDRHVKFVELFTQKYGNDFILMRSEDLIRENYFGGNFADEHTKFLGDYIAVGTTDKIFSISPLGHFFKGHHTSLTEEEMLVPLALIEC